MMMVMMIMMKMVSIRRRMRIGFFNDAFNCYFESDILFRTTLVTPCRHFVSHKSYFIS